jgi:serine/threonine protein kinase
VDNLGVVKLSDFGASTDLSEMGSGSKPGQGSGPGGKQALHGTAYWMAPEVIRQKATKTEWIKADIWSLGCTVIEMCTAKPPWSNYSNPVTALYQIACKKAAPIMPEVLTEDGVSFLQLCFKSVPHDRPGAHDLQKHPFLGDGDRHAHATAANTISASVALKLKADQSQAATLTGPSLPVDGREPERTPPSSPMGHRKGATDEFAAAAGGDGSSPPLTPRKFSRRERDQGGSKSSPPLTPRKQVGLPWCVQLHSPSRPPQL